MLKAVISICSIFKIMNLLNININLQGEKINISGLAELKSANFLLVR
jgi:hypothetical protein